MCFAIISGFIIYLFDIDLATNPILLCINIPIFGFTIYIGLKLTGFPLRTIFPNSPNSLSTMIWILIMSLGVIIIISDLSNLIYYFFPVDPEVLEIFQMIGNTGIGLFAAGIIAPITEELFFRSFLISGLLKNYSEFTSILTSSLLFGMIHDNIWQSVPAIGMGVFLGWIFVTTKNIWICIFIHSLQNLLFSLLESAEITITGLVYSVENGIQFQPLWLDLIGVIMFVMGLYFIKNKNQKNTPEGKYYT
ncbi:MAG: lysostaphin resistance A-like protein [Fidelibacterota bacterium]